MDKRNLPGVSAIEFCPAQKLFVDFQETITEGSVVDAIGDFKIIPIAGLAGCVVTSEVVSGEVVYTTEISFLIPDRRSETRSLIRDITRGCCAFRLTDIYKERYLVGLNEKPYPVFLSRYQIEAAPSGLRAFEAKITYTNTFSLLQIK